MRILNFNSKCAFWITQCTHDRSTCVFWITHYIHTSDRKCDSPFESVEKRHGCVWVACQSNMHVCCLHFLCMCSARYYRWKWLEGHTSSAPQNTILRSSHSYTDFVAWFARIVTGKHLCTVIWDAHFNYVLRRDLAYTRFFFCVFWILIQNAHLELKFKIRTLLSCENSLRLFSHESKVHNLNLNSKCAFWIKIWKTVFWTVCTPNYTSQCVIWNAHFKWRSGGVFQLRIT